jgi:hypothetical protein
LEVVVNNAVLLQELAGFQKAELLQRLQEALPLSRITNLRFRLGAVPTREE